MNKKTVWILVLVLAGFVVAAQTAPNHEALAQGRSGASSELSARRNAIEAELQSIAIVDRKLMIPMRDGKRMAADVYRPKDASKKYPAIFVRTPYNFNFWDVRSG